MAYLKPIYVRECTHCSGKATVTLHNWQNAETGAYCKRCGVAALGRLKRIEENEYAAKKGV